MPPGSKGYIYTRALTSFNDPRDSPLMWLSYIYTLTVRFSIASFFLTAPYTGVLFPRIYISPLTDMRWIAYRHVRMYIYTIATAAAICVCGLFIYIYIYTPSVSLRFRWKPEHTGLVLYAWCVYTYV